MCVVVSGCAGTARYRATDPIGSGCLVDHPMAQQVTGRESDASWEGTDDALYRRGERVPKDDLALATADDPRANLLATRARRDEKLGIAGLVAGGLVGGAGAGLIGWGIDDDRSAGVGSGAALAAIGAGAIVGGILFIEHAGHERVRAIDAYNEDAPPGCR